MSRVITLVAATRLYFLLRSENVLVATYTTMEETFDARLFSCSNSSHFKFVFWHVETPYYSCRNGCRCCKVQLSVLVEHPVMFWTFLSCSLITSNTSVSLFPRFRFATMLVFCFWIFCVLAFCSSDFFPHNLDCRFFTFALSLLNSSRIAFQSRRNWKFIFLKISPSGCREQNIAKAEASQGSDEWRGQHQ